MVKKLFGKLGKGKMKKTQLGKVMGKIGKITGTGTRKRRRKKSAMWYARELARLKLKKRYDKAKLRF